MARMFALLLLAWAEPSAASAQSADAQVREAERALAAGDVEAALHLARDARARDGGARTLALLGRVHEHLDPRAAFRWYRRALGRRPDAATRLRIAHGMQRARARFGVARVEPPFGGASVEVDGAPAEWEVGRRMLLLLPGRHQLAARAMDGRWIERSLDVAPGESVEVSFADTRPPGPQPLHREGPWLAGNLAMGGAAALGVISTTAWSAERAGQREAPAAIEHGYAQLQLGTWYGALFASLAHLMAGSVLHVLWDPAPLALQVTVLAALIGSAFVVGASAAMGVVDEPGSLLAAGAILGFASVTAGNLFFGNPHWDASSGLALAGLVRGLVELVTAEILFILADDRAGDDCAEPADADRCAQAASLETLAIGSLVAGVSLAGVSTALFVISPGGRWLFGRGHDVTAHLSPGGVSVHGRF